jgi:hypothetical protein
MRTGLTLGFGLVAGDAAQAVEWAGQWRVERPDVGLVVPLAAAEVAAVDPAAVTVEVAAASLPSLGRELAGRGLKLVVGGLGEGPVDLESLVDVHPSAVAVSASSRALGPAVALGLAVCGHALVTDVESAELLADAHNAGATAVSGHQLAPPLRSLDAVLAHLGQEEDARRG